jgi:hypothetical protein
MARMKRYLFGREGGGSYDRCRIYPLTGGCYPNRERKVITFLRILMYVVFLGTYGFLASLWDLQFAVPEMVGTLRF